MNQKDNRLLLAIICSSDSELTFDFAEMMRNIQLPPNSMFERVRGLPWGPARNYAAKAALDNKCHLAFLDTDILVEPDAYIKLLETELDIVSGLYYQKIWPYIPIIFNERRDAEGNIEKIPVMNWKPGDIVPCTFIPSGLTLYRLSLLKKMFEHFPRPFEWGIDVKSTFTEDEQLPLASEDFTFSFRAKSLGFQPYVNTNIIGLHEVRAVVGPQWVLGRPSSNPLYGVLKTS